MFLSDRNLWLGNTRIWIQDDTGEVILYTVTEIADDKVIVDGNHEWAGERVVFQATVTDVRAANTEEVTHEHVHGAGGHHH